jgi:hypothetical protein
MLSTSAAKYIDIECYVFKEKIKGQTIKVDHIIIHQMLADDRPSTQRI